MPQVLNIRHLPGFAEHRPIIPPDAVYIGRRNEADREAVIAAYEKWLRSQRDLMEALHELRGRDLVCWCAPLPCHGDVLLELANRLPS